MSIINQTVALALALAEQALTLDQLANAFIFNAISGCIQVQSANGGSSIAIVTNTIGLTTYVRYNNVVTSPPSTLTITTGFDLTPAYIASLITSLQNLGYTVTSATVQTLNSLSQVVNTTTITIVWQP
jgi:hypothetical protein